jgi:hypothetical protein
MDFAFRSRKLLRTPPSGRPADSKFWVCGRRRLFVFSVPVASVLSLRVVKLGRLAVGLDGNEPDPMDLRAPREVVLYAFGFWERL